MRSVNQNLRHVEKVENDLVKKENKIEKDIKEKEEKEKKEKEELKKKHENGDENWGEPGSNEHKIEMKPLVIHKGPPKSFHDFIS